MFPRRKSIWLPLLKVLDENGGPVKPSEAIEAVEEYFPELTAEDKEYKTPRGRVRWVTEDVPWARRDLARQDLMLNVRGQWQISGKGRVYLHEHWDSWVPEYVPRENGMPGESSENPRDADDAPPPAAYWWVNQGQSYESERDGGYIWAPLHTKSGATLGHWERVSGVLPGDVLIHYSNGAVRAIGIAEEVAEQRDNPHAGSHNAWEDKGWAANVHYYELRESYGRALFPEGFRRMDIPDGPFDRAGQVKQGYLWGFSEEAFQMFTGDPKFPWPPDVPLDRPSERSTSPSVAMESSGSYRNESFDLLKAHQKVNQIGYQISADDLLNVLLALETRPFVIFSGRSGTGKTTLARIIASLFGWTHYMVAVSPAWADPADLLGFISPLSHQRVAGALDDLLNEHQSHALLCLDEFNVAKVEHYFSDFISAMDSGVQGSFWGPLPSLKRLSEEQNEGLRLPERLCVVATMNFDDSVQSITPRVLDRANVMEFDVLSADALVVEKSLDWESMVTTKFQWSWKKGSELVAPKVSEMIRGIWPALHRSRGQFTHRVAQEMHRYVMLGMPFAPDLDRNDDQQLEALVDRQIAQRILPKFHGTAANRDVDALIRVLSNLRGNASDSVSGVDRLRVVSEFRNWGRFPKTIEKIEQLLTSYTEDGYASFW